MLAAVRIGEGWCKTRQTKTFLSEPSLMHGPVSICLYIAFTFVADEVRFLNIRGSRLRLLLTKFVFGYIVGLQMLRASLTGRRT